MFGKKLTLIFNFFILIEKEKNILTGIFKVLNTLIIYVLEISLLFT